MEELTFEQIKELLGMIGSFIIAVIVLIALFTEFFDKE